MILRNRLRGPDHRRLPVLRFLPARRALSRPGKNARLLPARTQRRRLRKPARPELRIQSRQSPRRRLPVAESLAARRSRHASSRNRTTWNPAPFPRQEKRDHESLSTSCHPERNKCFTHATTCAVEGPRSAPYRSLVCRPAPRRGSLCPDPHRNRKERHHRQARRRRRSRAHQPRPGHGRSRTHQGRRQRQLHLQARQQGPHLVRVIHQEVTYHRMAPPGTTSVEVEVYDVAKNVEGIEVVADIMRVQVEQGQLEIERTFAVQNNSKPPRTQMNEHNLEFYVPEGATDHRRSGHDRRRPAHQLRSRSRRREAKNTLLVPVPATSRRDALQCCLQLPYTGQHEHRSQKHLSAATFRGHPAQDHPLRTGSGRQLQPTNDPGQPDANVQVASDAGLGQPLAFKLSGEGTLAAPSEKMAKARKPQVRRESPRRRPRPAHRRSPTLRRISLVDSRRHSPPFFWSAESSLPRGSKPPTVPPLARKASPWRPLKKTRDLRAGPGNSRARISLESSRGATGDAGRSEPSRPRTMLLEGLKEELFQLEVEHKQGRISQQEYEKTKAALDHTLQRALKRESQKA